MHDEADLPDPERPTVPDAGSRAPSRAENVLRSLRASAKRKGDTLGDAVATSLDGYELGDEIARGGMGVVLRGRDKVLGRDVALKILREEHRDNPAMLERFVEEAQIGGQLQHPGIAPVYELGVGGDARPFFTMKLIGGDTLEQLLKARSTPNDDLRRFLSIFEAIAQTVAYAHEHGVVHRDLKPDNVMVGAFGEVQVVDWGLAKVLGQDETMHTDQPEPPETRDKRSDAPAGSTSPDSPSLHGPAPSRLETVRSGSDSSGTASMVGAVLGTVHYMPPEQARGDLARVGRPSDVFALGAILFRILTGKAPYPERDTALMEALECDSAPFVAKLTAAQVPDDLRTLCLSCLSKEPEDRPSDGRAVARTVAEYLTQAEQRALDAQLKAAEARKARAYTTVIAGLILLVGGAAAGIWQHLQGQREERLDRARLAVGGALDEASALRAIANARRDPRRWDEAAEALARAEAAAEGSELDDATRHRLMTFAEELARERTESLNAVAREQALQASLERFEALRSLEVTDFDPLDQEAVSDAYLVALRHQGLDFASMDIDSLCERIGESDIGFELAMALDDCAKVRRSLEMQVGRPPTDPTPAALLIVAQAGDTDEERNVLRDALLDDDVDKLLALKHEWDLESMPAPTLSLLGAWLSLAYQWVEALDVFQLGLTRFPDHFRLTVQVAESFAHHPGSRTEESIEYFRAALALRPKSLRVRERLAEVLRQHGRTHDARMLIEDLLRLAPTTARARLSAAELALQEQDPDSADRHLAALLALDGVNPDDQSRAHELQGRVHESRDDWRAAEAAYRAAISVTPHRSIARRRLAHLLRSNDPTRLEAHLVDSVQRVPQDAELHRLYGMYLIEQERDSEAVNSLNRSLQIQPSNQEAMAELTFALHRLGASQTAMDQMHIVAQSNRTSAGATAIASTILYHLGDTKGAVEYARDFVRRTGPAGGLGDWLAYMLCFRRDGEADPDAAYAAALQVLEEVPDAPHAIGLLGVLEYRRGKPLAALRRLESISWTGDDFRFRLYGFYRAMAHETLGEHDAAEVWLEYGLGWRNEFRQQLQELSVTDTLFSDYAEAEAQTLALMGRDERR